MRNFIKLIEDFEEDESDDEVFGAQLDREKHVEQLIRYAFKKIGLPIREGGNSILYSEDFDREATVRLDDPEYSLDQLMKLKETGLSSEFHVAASASNMDELVIRFTVDPLIDSAKID